MKRLILLWLCLAVAAAAFAQEELDAKNLRRKVAIGKFSNQSRYARGIFYDEEDDPVCKQAMQLLSVKLTQSGKFILLERGDLNLVAEELATTNKIGVKIPADYIIIGAITELNHKTEGHQGAFSNSKTQSVETRVSLKLVDVATGQIIFADEGSGSAFSHAKTVMGMGGKSGYDTTLEDKAISNAIDGLVGNVIQKCLDAPWRAYLLGEMDGRYIISGGRTQGLRENDVYVVMSKGRVVTNPQTGMDIELPGREVARIRIEELVDAQTPENEVSFASLTDGSIDTGNLASYFITE